MDDQPATIDLPQHVRLPEEDFAIETCGRGLPRKMLNAIGRRERLVGLDMQTQNFTFEIFLVLHDRFEKLADRYVASCFGRQNVPQDRVWGIVMCDIVTG